MKALVVQDDPETLAVLSKYLSSRGHEVIAASDAEEGWDAFQRGHFALVLLDRVLLAGDALELCRRMRSAPGGDTSVILIIIGRGEAEHVSAALDAGANDLVSRPFSLELLDVRLAIAERQVREIRERKIAHEELAHRALHDSLTSLPNRILLADRLQQAVNLGERNRSHVAVLLLDLDGFKDVNDTFGHGVGDLVLDEVGSRLQRTVRASDTVARVGGDEFAVVMPATDSVGASTLAKEVLRGIAEPLFVVEGVSVCIGVSIGVTIWPEHGQDGQTLVRRADAAMYRAKQTRGSYVLYDPRQDAERSDRFSLREETRLNARGLMRNDVVWTRMVGMES